jgi:hypothetical protein
LPFLLPFLLPLLNAASGCRLAKQNHCEVQYRRPITDVEGIRELKLVSSLITHHSSFFLPAPRFTAFLLLSSRSIAFRCPLFITHHSSFIIHCSRSCYHLLSPVIAENLIQNCQLNQSVVRSAPVFALYLQELQ